jgi:hypothetical protein
MIERKLREELPVDLLSTINGAIFMFKENENGIKEKINLLTKEERLFRKRYYRNRQVAPRRMAQRVELQRESLIDCQKLRDLEEAQSTVEIVKKKVKEDLAQPLWRRLLGDTNIEYVR